MHKIRSVTYSTGKRVVVKSWEMRAVDAFHKTHQGKILALELNFLGNGFLETIKLLRHFCSS